MKSVHDADLIRLFFLNVYNFVLLIVREFSTYLPSTFNVVQMMMRTFEKKKMVLQIILVIHKFLNKWMKENRNKILVSFYEGEFKKCIFPHIKKDKFEVMLYYS